MYPIDENTLWLINTLTKAIKTGDLGFEDSESIKASELFLIDIFRAFSIVRANGICLDDTQVDRIAQIDCIIREHGSCSLAEKEVYANKE
jgi:hypothetical protein